MSRSHMSRIRHLVRAACRRAELTGCAVAAVLVALALINTDWRPYPRQPDEILDRVAATRSALDGAVWPESERRRFVNTDVGSLMTSRMYGDLAQDRHRYSRRMSHSPGQTLRLRDPEFERVQHLIADSGRVLIELRPPRAAPPLSAEVETPDVEAWEDELRRHRSGRNHRGSAMERSLDDYDTVLYSEGTYAGGDTSTMGTVSRNGRGYPFVAVRGLFDVSAQITAYMDAVHCNRADAEKLLELIDFSLERQTYDRKRNAWGTWEPVDVQVFRDVALAASGFEPDVVSTSATDAVITCPLLMRITGRWESLATHPLLQGGQVSPSVLEREAAFHEAILELIRDGHRRPRATPTPKRGFSDLLVDGRRLEEDMFDPVLSAPPVIGLPRGRFGSPVIVRSSIRDNPALEELVQRIAHRMETQQADRDLREWIRNRITREPSRQLLFRYFDFNVEPGATYRYQVRLELRNPNFGRSLAAAGGAAHVVEGETRLTPWSAPTEPVRVRPNVDYFLAGLEQTYRQHPHARLHVFQYDLQLGTVVQQELPVEFGQRIAGTVRAVMLNPAAGRRTEGDYQFRSRDTLLDALTDMAFDRELHSDLQLPPGSLGEALIPEYALVLTGDELRTIDRRSRAEELARAELYVDLQRKQLQHLRSGADEDGGWSNEYEKAMYEELFGQPTSVEPQQRRRNMLQRRR